MTSHDSDIRHARPLNRQDIKTLLLASLGGALEFYDFVIFVYFANSIGKLFFPPDMPAWLKDLQTYGIFAAGYLARPVGGIVMAHFGDMLGRKRMFTLSVFLMAVPTLLVGLLPTYSALGYGAPILLLVLRILQGAAIGGEVPGAWVFVSEHVPAKRVGMACGMLTGGLTSGILLGSLAATAVNVNLAPEQVLDYGWRIPFLLGGLLGLLAVYLRSYLQETPVFEVANQKIENVNIGDAQVRPPLRQFPNDLPPPLSHLQFLLWRIVENVEADLIADAPPAQQRGVEQARHDGVDPVVECVSH